MSKLYLIPTPIGNLRDITLRALEILESADIVLAEDTRKSGILLKHFNISKSMIPHHKFNEHKNLEKIIEKIKNGTVAMITDAGTPAISDPGYLLVRECIKQDIEIETLPGPTAFIPALVNSGIPSDRFCFEGFLPHKKGRKKRLKQLTDETRTMVFYESPYRLLKTLEQFREFFGGDRLASVSRELTKIHEENIRGSLDEVIRYYSGKTIKGEIVIVLGGNI